MAADQINTINDQFVGSNSAGLVVSMPLAMRTRQDVFRHIAWLEVCAEVLNDDPNQKDSNGDPYTLDQYRAAVRST